MKHDCYKVIFTSLKESIVYCNWTEEAKILAQAEQINLGNSYNVSKVIRIS